MEAALIDARRDPDGTLVIRLAGDWSLRSALVRYAQPDPGRVPGSTRIRAGYRDLPGSGPGTRIYPDLGRVPASTRILAGYRDLPGSWLGTGIYPDPVIAGVTPGFGGRVRWVTVKEHQSSGWE